MKKRLLTIIAFQSLSVLADAEIKVIGNYITPPSTSAPAETLPLGYARLTKDDSGALHLQYQMPEDLVGSQAKMIQVDQTSQGPAGTVLANTTLSLTCLTSDDSLSCIIKYPTDYSSNLNAADINSFLNKKYGVDSDSAVNKINLSTHFLHDPEGFLVLAFVKNQVMP